MFIIQGCKSGTARWKTHRVRCGERPRSRHALSSHTNLSAVHVFPARTFYFLTEIYWFCGLLFSIHESGCIHKSGSIHSTKEKGTPKSYASEKSFIDKNEEEQGRGSGHLPTGWSRSWRKGSRGAGPASLCPAGKLES